MPLRYDIDAARRLVLIEYWDRAGIDETAEIFGQYIADPHFAPGQIHLFDLARVTDVDRDFPKFMQFQARTASQLPPGAMPSLLVYFAPTDIARLMAGMVRKSWQGLDGPTIAIIEDEAEALAVAGCTEKRFSDLRRTISAQRI